MLRKESGIVIFVVLTILSPYAIAQESCVIAKPNYERRCGEATSLSSMTRLLNPGNCAIVDIQARSRWNASGIYLQDKAAYSIEVVDGNKDDWCDGSIKTDANGWVIDSDKSKISDSECKGAINKGVNLGMFRNAAVKSFEFLRLRRSNNTKADWFTLTGYISDGIPKLFTIGLKATVAVRKGGEFCSFANDLSTRYSNNSGSLRLKITRESPGGILN